MEDRFTIMMKFICPLCPIYYDRCTHIGCYDENSCPCSKELKELEESNETFKK